MNKMKPTSKYSCALVHETGGINVSYTFEKKPENVFALYEDHDQILSERC